MSTAPQGKKDEGTGRLRLLALRLDGLLIRPPGAWLADNVGNVNIQDLDLDEIEVLRCKAYEHWVLATGRYYRYPYRDSY